MYTFIYINRTTKKTPKPTNPAKTRRSVRSEWSEVTNYDRTTSVQKWYIFWNRKKCAGRQPKASSVPHQKLFFKLQAIHSMCLPISKYFTIRCRWVRNAYDNCSIIDDCRLLWWAHSATDVFVAPCSGGSSFVVFIAHQDVFNEEISHANMEDTLTHIGEEFKMVNSLPFI